MRSLCFQKLFYARHRTLREEHRTQYYCGNLLAVWVVFAILSLKRRPFSPCPWRQEPYRLVYFVVTDQMRTTIAALRAVLKEG